MLKTHFGDPNKEMAADYYTSMLKTDAFPQAAALFPEDEVFYFQQDLASSHAAKATTKCLRNKGGAWFRGFPPESMCRHLASLSTQNSIAYCADRI